MNAPGTFLLAAVLVAGGLFAYDARRPGGEPAAPAGAVSVPPRPTPDLEGLADLEARVARLERRLRAQRRELAALRRRPQEPATEEDLRVETAFLRPPRRAADGTPAIAPETLDALRAYVAEAERRIRADHRRGLVEASIARLRLDLEEEERARVLGAVLDYQAKTRTFWSDMHRRGITDRPQQLAELDRLRRTLIDAVRPYVAENDLDRVIDGLIGRGAIRPGRPVPRRPWER